MPPARSNGLPGRHSHWSTHGPGSRFSCRPSVHVETGRSDASHIGCCARCGCEVGACFASRRWAGAPTPAFCFHGTFHWGFLFVPVPQTKMRATSSHSCQSMKDDPITTYLPPPQAGAGTRGCGTCGCGELLVPLLLRLHGQFGHRGGDGASGTHIFEK
jgi:hypothetical protein